MTDASIVGWAHTPFGKLEDPGLEQLIGRVASAAIDHAGLAPSDVDGIFVGVFNNGLSRQGFEGALVGVAVPELAGVPSIHVENACATGSAALYSALDFVGSGRGRVALVVGAEKMTALPSSEVGNILLSGCYRPEEADIDGGFAGVFARIAAAYFQRYGDRSAELAWIAAKNHANGVANPFAQMRRDLGFEFCNTPSERNPYVAPPLRRTDCSLISDGAAAIVVASADIAAYLPQAVSFRARAQANEIFPISRRDPTDFAGARRAWAAALDQAGMTLEDLHLVETHDCFTIAELIEYEAMGLAEPGQGFRVVREGIATKEGRLPINPSGGLKAKGHPIGATGVSQHIMACLQVTNTAGEMQIPGATRAGVFNMGGAAVANYVSILERSK